MPHSPSGSKPSGSRTVDPYLQGRLTLRRGGRSAAYLVPHSVFSSRRIDHGTLLLLDNLPPGTPESFLDLGCGYGALGLEVAARHPGASGLLVDRDLLAVEFSRRNAALHSAPRVRVEPSLGYRDLPAGAGPFDWVLSNLPARAGETVLEALVQGGRARLKPGGEMRVVVISPLADSLRRIAEGHGLPCEPAAATRGHTVFAFPALSGPDRTDRDSAEQSTAISDEIYDRDCVRLELPEPLRLVRPSDLADEPHRLAHAIPLLARHLPEEPPARVLVFRSGYGLLAALALERYRGARVAAQDRDLLAVAFTRRNCERGMDRLRVAEVLQVQEAAGLGPFDLILGELSPPLGEAATLHEIAGAREALAPGGRALIVGLGKQWREFLKQGGRPLGLRFRAESGPAALFELGGEGST